MNETTPQQSPPDAEPGDRRRRSRAAGILWAVAKWTLFAMVAWLVGRALATRFADVSWSERRFDVPLILLSLACMVASRALTCLPYGVLIGRFGRHPAWAAMAGATWASQAGKYLPGKVGTLVGMAWLLRRRGTPVRATISTIVIGDGLSVVLGLAAAVPLALCEPLRSQVPLAWLWAALLLVAGLVFLHPRVLGTVGNSLLRRLRQPTLETLPRLGNYLAATLATVAHLLLIGAALWLMAASVTRAELGWLPAFLLGMAVAETLGFVALFAPAGLGVQEGVLMVVLAPLLAAGDVAIVVVAIRFARTLADAIIMVAGFAVLRLTRGRHGEPA